MQQYALALMPGMKIKPIAGILSHFIFMILKTIPQVRTRRMLL